MDSPPLAPLGTVGVDLAHQYESQFTGIVLATMLCGITIVQAWIYINDNRDSWIFRILVFILILADIATTVLDLKLMHRNLVQNFGNVEALAVAHLDIISEYGITVVIVFMVQLFLLSRVYLSKKEWWWMSAVIAVFSIGAFVTGIKAVNDLSNHPQMVFLTSRDSEILFGISGGFSVVADILVTCGLTWLLATGQAEVKRCRTTLQKLLMYVVCRGLLVSVTQLLFFIMYLAKPAALWWVPFHFMSSKFYVITMVALLNARPSRHLEEDDELISTAMFTHTLPSAKNRQGIMVHKSVEMTQFEEDYEGGGEEEEEEERSSQQKVDRISPTQEDC